MTSTIRRRASWGARETRLTGPPNDGRALAPGLGRILLALSGIGFPLTQLAIRRFGRGGALLVEGVCGGLLVRDAALIARGTPGRLRTGAAALLWLEAMSALVATILGALPVVSSAAVGHAKGPWVMGSEALRRIAVGALFGLHTYRFQIYLEPGHGRRAQAPGSRRVDAAASQAPSGNP